MLITYLGHAGLFVETKDCRILCDPWKHENPKFFDSWYVYPNNNDLDWDYYMESVDFLYVSHVHQDHLDKPFLKELISKNKNVKVILPDYRWCELKNLLTDIGFKNFIIGQAIYGETTLVTYVCETLDREREDSALLIDDGDKTFLNINDSKILPDHKEDIFKRFKSIDMMACQVSGASWHPNCYDYDDETMKDKCSLHRSRCHERFIKVKKDLNVKKSVITAGPPCFLDEGLDELNFYGNNASVFPDPWQIKQFDREDDIYRVLPGDKFTYDSVTDRKNGINKKEFISSNIKKNLYNNKISSEKYEIVKSEFLDWFNYILSNSTWLKKYIVGKFYLSIEDYESFRLDFRNGKVFVDEVSEKGVYYVVTMPSKMFYKLIQEKETDWENAFLSCRCKFKRNPDTYNPWILGFFRNLKVKQLNDIRDSLGSDKIKEETMIVGDYEVARYCPHQNYDLKHHSSVDLKNKTITCLGHGWTWDLESGAGVNTKCNLKCGEVKV